MTEQKYKLTDGEILEAFKGARFGDGSEEQPHILREKLAKGVLSRLTGVRSSWTVESSMIDLGLMSRKTMRPTVKGIAILRNSNIYKNAIRGGV